MSEVEWAFYEKLFAEREMISYDSYVTLPVKKRGAAGAIRENLMARLKYLLVHMRRH